LASDILSWSDAVEFNAGGWLGEIGVVNPRWKAEGSSAYLWFGDITRLSGEGVAVVNAANWSLRHGGGICGAIHRAAGPELEVACFSACPDGLETTLCVLTPGFGLQVPYVIHAVTPMHGRAEELEATYRNIVQLAVASRVRAVCIPAISTGSHGFDRALAARIAVRTARDELAGGAGVAVIFCAFTPEDLACYKSAMVECFNRADGAAASCAGVGACTETGIAAGGAPGYPASAESQVS